ncbi:MAG: PQQ-binding-like beta-propeller repeat protein [Bacteroidota bacterium]
MKIISILLLYILCFPTPLLSQSISQFRGPSRDGVYPESNLMQTWPGSGPALLWLADSVGSGFSSPVVTSDRIYLAGETDSIGHIFAFDKKGKPVWQTTTGKEWMINFPGPRSSPTVVGDLLYYCSSLGQIMCIETATGKKNWSVDMVNDLHGINVRFGYAESLLVDNDYLYCSPGGADTNIVALNRFDGKLLWKSKAAGDSASYCSPSLITHNGRKILATLTIHHFIGLDAKTGELLWSLPNERTGDIHCNAPLYQDGFLYYNDRAGNGFVKFELAPDSKTLKEVWRNFKAGNVQSGFIKIDDFFYGSRYRPARFECLDATTGQVADSLKFPVGSTIFADGLLYCYGEDGNMGLIRPGKGKSELISSFKVTDGSREHFAHPVISEGILYIRHGNALMAYDIRMKKP